ncbi:hypothetical protein DFH08DRAFT_820793 [Mycena albidolilacea]|uniref:Uncharacterized protein n=1 Tax=Mycena albidolilacea TaxID=1033008 RepID=A0AAD6ZBK0_9AGAR|nr:hypothetical protein DFH08DRAFT_820793 [Mycena albidolilacea]
MGVLSSQFANYFTWYNDKTPLKIIVGVLALLTLPKSIQALLTHPGGVASRQSTHGEIRRVPYVQSYFCWRLWVISKKWYVVVPITVLLFFAFLSIVVATYYITVEQNNPIKEWFAAHLGSVFAGDIPHNGVLPTHIPEGCAPSNCLSAQFGFPPQRIQLTNERPDRRSLTLWYIRSPHLGDREAKISMTDVHLIVSTAYNVPLPKLYAVSMMWTLNARRAITAYPSSEHGMTGTSNEISGRRSRAHAIPQFDVVMSSGSRETSRLRTTCLGGTWNPGALAFAPGEMSLNATYRTPSRLQRIQATHASGGHSTL